nr:MAG TPA: hypothetical protein [Caudoviricetes sp.]
MASVVVPSLLVYGLTTIRTPFLVTSLIKSDCPDTSENSSLLRYYSIP